MKKVVFYFCCIALLILLMPTHCYALKYIVSHNFKIIKHKQLYISNNTQNKNSHFYTDLIEEDCDSGNTSERKKHTCENNSFILPSFPTEPFTDNKSSKSINFNRYFLNFTQPYFIYFRVLRL
jgi:hypothetical protein